MEISLARPSDCLEIAEMSRLLIENGLRWSWKPSRVLGLIRHPDCIVITAKNAALDVAKDQEAAPRMYGFAAMQFYEIHGHLSLLAVSQQQRREGIGKLLLDWLELSAVTAGLHKISLEVRSKNANAIRFYENSNYHTDGLVKGYYQGKEDALHMSHNLISREDAALQPR